MEVFERYFSHKPYYGSPPLQYTTHTGDTWYIFSYMGKIYALIDYISSMVNVDDKDTNLQSYLSSCDEIVIQ